ncbi:MAG: hypothetical protein QM660_09085 [Dysgonomonas sp.]
MASGFESGANEFYIPGGKTAGGILEAVTDPIPISNIKITHVIVE